MSAPIYTSAVLNLIKLLCLLVGLGLSSSSPAKDFVLTTTERQWLSDHPVIRIAPDPDFQPFEWITASGEYQGMAADYMHLIGKRLGVRFEIKKVSDWSQVIALAQNHEVDVLPAVARTEQREQYLLFTDVYISVPGVLVSGLNHMGIDQLDGHQVAVVRNYLWDERLTAAKTGILIKRVDDLKFGLELASLGAVEATITDLASATNMIEQENLSNLHIMSDASHKLGKLKLSIGVRADWPELRSLFNRALTSISTQEIETIRSKWVKSVEPAFWQDRHFWNYMLAAIAIILALFSAFFIWNRTLKRQVIQQSRQLHAAQAHLMQAEKMESVGRLAAGVAHEVKNPLAIIQMGADYLAKEVPADKTIAEVIRDIEDAIQRANTVILGLLDFSRDKNLELSTDNINKVILNSLHLVRHELRQRNINIETDLDENLPDIPLDANKLQQVFVNLIINAAHAMNHTGTLLICSKLKTLTKQSELEQFRKNIFEIGEQVIQIEVADTGPGIDEEHAAKIFDLFYTTKSVGEGTGLGLSVSRNIVNLHNGCIDISNRSEGGASAIMLFKLT